VENPNDNEIRENVAENSRLVEALASNREVGRGSVQTGEVQGHYDCWDCECQAPRHTEPKSILHTQKQCNRTLSTLLFADTAAAIDPDIIRLQ